MNHHSHVIDTFPAFLQFWDRARELPLSEQIERWASEYLAAWPELLARQIDDYSGQHIDWREIARERIFPYLDERLRHMEQAHTNLLTLCEPVFADAEQVLGIEESVLFVIHVGIGCGAGWATAFQGLPAVLLGLESIAENSWSEPEPLKGLLAHEIGHLFFQLERKKGQRSLGDDGWAQLYDEGFAQYCEDVLIDNETFHQQASRQDDDWLAWCQAHKSWLAVEFLRTMEADQPVSKFFGSWFAVEGQSETGYFLGHEVIKLLVRAGHSLKEISLLEPKDVAKPILEEMARHA